MDDTPDQVPDETPDTVTDAVALLIRDGYTANFGVTASGLRCGACEHIHDPHAVGIERIYRFEGDSDPGDEAIVFGLHCPACDTRGSLVAAYGASTDPDEADVVAQLVDRR